MTYIVIKCLFFKYFNLKLDITIKSGILKVGGVKIKTIFRRFSR